MNFISNGFMHSIFPYKYLCFIISKHQCFIKNIKIIATLISVEIHKKSIYT